MCCGQLCVRGTITHSQLNGAGSQTAFGGLIRGSPFLLLLLQLLPPPATRQLRRAFSSTHGGAPLQTTICRGGLYSSHSSRVEIARAHVRPGRSATFPLVLSVGKLCCCCCCSVCPHSHFRAHAREDVRVCVQEE